MPSRIIRRFGLFEHRDEMTADELAGAQLLRRLIRQSRHAARQLARGLQMTILSHRRRRLALRQLVE
jgi:hypothetical protein